MKIGIIGDGRIRGDGRVMAVLIKDMKMPKDCSHCEFWHTTHTGRIICKRTKQEILCNPQDIFKRADFCPLVEVTEE